ncbi:hypothetical protein BJ741DRAFT_713646 [Chytriomyces cf. hyalinus JEL632]|nr:hypothetical protein BJ741DRAFT_713646 [Chytriomyces cf. hyalinus JEL632]
MTRLLRSVFQHRSQHAHLRFDTSIPKTESLAQVAARFRKENQVRCVLANHPDLPAFHVTIDSIASVARLKKVIRAEKIKDLGHVDACKLTLVRIFKTNEGTLTKNDLQKWQEPLSKASYGNDPENATDDVSIFHRTRGACLEKNKMFFKVMNSKKKTRFYMNATPDEMYHVLVLLPHESKLPRLARLQRFLGTAPKDSKPTPNSGVSGMEGESQAMTCMRHIKWKDESPIVSARNHQNNSFFYGTDAQLQGSLRSRSDASNMELESQAITCMEHIKWKDETPIVSARSHQNIFNGTDAVKKLQKTHQANFLRATTGADWVIPIAENGHGFSEFSTHYISKSQETWDMTTRDAFKYTLCSCHTVRVQFTTTQPFTEGSFNSTMINYLKAALEPTFISPPLMLSNEYETVEDFLEDLTQVAGPVHIVLDGIENAFKGNDLKVRHQFLLFCRKILSHWFALPNVFFIVLGRASFINNVGRKPVAPMGGSSFSFERLNPSQVQNQSWWSDHSALQVNIKSAATVLNLKQAILAENISALAHVDVIRLALVRVFKEGVGGFTKRDIDKWKKLSSRAAYGRDPEDAKDEISMFRATPGASIQREGVFFKRQMICTTVPQQTKLSRTSSTPPKHGVADVEIKSRAITYADVFKWKDEMPSISSLSQPQINSVNEGEAVAKLQKIQSANFERAVSKSGQEWMIPIADSAHKDISEISSRYINISRQAWPDEVLNQDSFNSAVLAYLKQALKLMFIMPPSMLTKNYKSVAHFLNDFTDVAGPVYIVLDESGNAFEGDEFEGQDRFILFCKKIVGNWLYLPKVFFVVLDHPSFFNDISLQPTSILGGYKFKRLNF